MSPARGNPEAAVHEAAARGEWSVVRHRFAELDPAEVTLTDLADAADASWWSGLYDESMALRQRCYAQAVREGDAPRAAYCAWFLWFDHGFKGEVAVASGWLARAERHAADVRGGFEDGLVAVARAVTARGMGQVGVTDAAARRALEIGEQLASQDLIALATLLLGRLALDAGRLGDGLAGLDDAMCSVVADQLQPLFTGIVYCEVISACVELADLRRAAEWTAAALAWCDTQPDGAPYRGVCRVHRAEVVGLQGEWAAAELEAERASEELLALEPVGAANAFYALGDIRRRRGDDEGAEAAYRRAHELGRDPHPGLALLRLRQGRLDEAASVLRLELSSGSSFGRAVLAGAQVEVALALGDLDTAAGAIRSLEELAAPDDAPLVLRALAASASAARDLATGEAESACRGAVRAWTTFRDLRLPYEAALARALVGRAKVALGDVEGGRLEVEAARTALQDLGAVADADGLRRLLSRGSGSPGGLTDREVEVLRLVAAGMTNRQVAGELVLSEHTVARHLQNIFTKLGISSRSAATAFAYEHDLV